MKRSKNVVSRRSRPHNNKTLADFIQPDLDILFVGINPGTYSAKRGHYYARPTNRFWKALYASDLIPILLNPQQDGRVLEYSIGLTDVVKRPTHGIHEITPEEFRRGVDRVRRLILKFYPRIVCFNGLAGYQAVFGKATRPGLQPQRMGSSKIFVIPSTSPRNAAHPFNKIVRHLKLLNKIKDDLPVRLDRTILRE